MFLLKYIKHSNFSCKLKWILKSAFRKVLTEIVSHLHGLRHVPLGKGSLLRVFDSLKAESHRECTSQFEEAGLAEDFSKSEGRRKSLIYSGNDILFNIVVQCGNLQGTQ